jgi:hypothetical protein
LGKQTTSRFFRSINAEHDHYDATALEGYLATAGARRVLNRIAPARTSMTGSRSWTLTGPYGTGKSAFCAFAAQLFAPSGFPGHTEARAVLRRADEDAFDGVSATPKSFHGLWPVVITGSREPIQVAFLRGLRTSLGHLQGKIEPSVLRHITRLLNDAVSGKTVGDREIVEALEKVVQAVCIDTRAASGIFIVVDELGKLLEFASSHPAQSDLYVLQHIAEFAARSTQPVLFLTVLHQDFSGYATKLSSVERAEWDKVRGRFEDVLFEEPAEEFLRLVAAARSGDNPLDDPPKLFADLCRQTAKLGLNPPGMSKAEFSDLLLRSIPLHPLVTVLLGHIFRKLAQNERSAFSFLTSSEPHGLADLIAYNPQPDRQCYRLHHLYDYLIHAVGDGLYLQRNGKRWAEVESALDRLPDAGPTAIAVLKTIGLLGAVGEWRRVAASKDVIEHSLLGEASHSEVNDAIQWLRTRSAIVPRSYNDSFAIWQGSDIDIEERVKEARGRLNPADTLATLAQAYLTPKPIVARRHLFEKGTLRYFAVEFVNPSGLLQVASGPPERADGRIAFLMADNAQQDEQAKQAASSEGVAARTDTVIAIPSNLKAFDNLLREASALDWVKSHTPELEGDATARRELRARVAEINRQLDVLLKEVFAPDADIAPKCAWFHAGQEVKLLSRRALNSLLSDACDQVFGKTPVILNELVNRKELSSAAAGGRRNLIEAMLTKGTDEMLGITGNPPEKSIYLSVLQKTGIHRVVDDVHQFAGPHHRSDPGVRAVWARIEEFFDTCVEQVRTVAELFESLAAAPFGLREGPIPIIVCATLIAADADVALYEQGNFVPQLTTPVYERLMKAPSKFTLRRWKVTGVRAAVFNQLAEMLGKSRAIGAVGKRNLLDVVRPLLRFADKLSDYAKHTVRLRPEARAVREALLSTREADQLLYTELPKACGFPPILADSKSEHDFGAEFLAALRKAIAELQRCYEDLLSELAQAIQNAFATSGSLGEARTALVARAELLRGVVSDATLRAFIARATEKSLKDMEWVESIASLLGERPPSTWKDQDRGTFEVAIAKVSRLFTHLEPLAFCSGTNGAATGHAVRIGITTRESAERERVVHVSAAAAKEVDRLERALQHVLDSTPINGFGDLHLAALARLAEKLIGSHAPESEAKLPRTSRIENT